MDQNEIINKTGEKTKKSVPGKICAFLAGKAKGALKWISTAPLFFKILAGVFVISVSVHIVSTFSSSFADFMIKYPNAGVRWILAKITNLIPFSLGEFVIFTVPVALIALISLGVYLIKKGSDAAYKRYICSLMCILFTLYSLFVFTLAPGYRGKPLGEKIGLIQKDITKDELYATALWLADKTNEYCTGNVSDAQGASCMPYSLDEMNKKLNDAYARLSEKYSFVSPLRSNLKYVILSKPMTYTHISGVYSYYTGEANINVNFPDYSIPYTAAHELAHQRGTAPENEANFVAFLACLESDDRYILYSAYSNMLEYCMNALYEADDDLYYKVYDRFDSKVIGEFNSYSLFYEKYRDNVVGTVSGKINDTYLQSQGQEAGSRSYGLVVDLAVAYYYTNIDVANG